MKVIEF